MESPGTAPGSDPIITCAFMSIVGANPDSADVGRRAGADKGGARAANPKARAGVDTDQQQRTLGMVKRFTVADAAFERSPGQDGEVFAANMVDQRHGGPITIGYGRYGPDQELAETMAVDDVIVVLEGRLSVTGSAGTVTAGPGEIIYMPKGEKVTIRSHEQGAVTAYVTYPHWQEARD